MSARIRRGPTGSSTLVWLGAVGTGPRTREAYLAERREPIHKGLYVTDEEDLARAYLAAIEAVQVGRSRFDAVWIAGDEQEQTHNLSKARQLLGWVPESHKYLEE